MKKPSKRQIRIEKEKEWKQAVFTRDGFVCQICLKKENQLHPHHILPRTYAEHKYEVDNGLCLCGYCHHFFKKLSPHQNAIAFNLWLLKNKPELYAIALDRLQKC